MLHLDPVASPAQRTNSGLRLVERPGGRDVGSQGTPLADAELVALSRAGHLSAFESLYRRHAGFALNLAVRIQGNTGDVEDIVHDAFLRAHERLGELREPGRFRAWLGSIVVTLVRGRLRRKRMMGVLGISYADPIDLESIASHEAGPEARAQLAQVYALLRTLPTDDRVAWTLRVLERHPLDEVARLASCSLATAKRRIARTQRYLTEHFVTAFGEAHHD